MRLGKLFPAFGGKTTVLSSTVMKSAGTMLIISFYPVIKKQDEPGSALLQKTGLRYFSGNPEIQSNKILKLIRKRRGKMRSG